MPILLLSNILTKITKNAAHFNNRRQKNQHSRRNQGTGGHDLPTFLHSEKKKRRQMEKIRSFEVETIKRLLLFQPLQSNQNSKIMLVGLPWLLTILYNIPWRLHFEIHFTCLENYTCLHSQCKIVKYQRSARTRFKKGVNLVII